jgi:F1F0 ATPase subunit 2
MNGFMFLAPPLAAGLLLGAMFFCGLWWTVIRGVSSPWPAIWFLGSMLLRTSVALAGFYYVGRDHWERWLLCLLGFILARLVVERLIRHSVERHSARAPETSYAP